MNLGRLVLLCVLVALLCLFSLVYYSISDNEKRKLVLLREHGRLDPLQNCDTPFGELLGIADGVPAYSNCNRAFKTTYVNYVNLQDPMDNGRRADPSETQVIMTGYRHTAIDFYMRWLVWNRGLMPLLVENTDQLWKATDFRNPAKPQQGWEAVFMANYEEVSSIQERIFNAPRRADAVVYRVEPKTAPTGHIAVIVRVEDDVEEAGGPARLKELKRQRLHPRRVYVAEENFRNAPWEGRNYSRVIQFKWRAAPGDVHEGYLVDPDGLSVLGIMRIGKPKPIQSRSDPYQEALEKEEEGDL